MRRFNSMYLLPAVAVLCAPLWMITNSCGGGGNSSDGPHELPDTMNVATLYGPASFFFYRDTMMGYDYDLMEELAKEHGFFVNWVIANSIEEAIEMVDAGDAEILAAEVPDTDPYKKQVILCGPYHNIEQVLVQPPGDTVIVDVSQLAGRTVYVEKDTKGAEVLEKLNQDMGDVINVRAVDADSLATEDMLAAVARGDIKLAVTDNETAKFNKTYHPDLNITLALNRPEKAQWAVAKDNRWLADSLDTWMKQAKPREAQREILQKYFDSQKNFPVEGASYDREFKNGYASPYDELYKKHTADTKWDWRLLAAQGYTESKFNAKAKSWAGAKGVMQIMPKTARQFGLKANEMTDPSRNIETAVKILNSYDNIMAQKVKDPIERQKFTMAAYNAGPGHVLDAIALAKKYGYDPEKWDGNVEKAMLMKMNKKYYRDPVVKYGYSRGRETVDYVNRIWNYYDEAKSKIPA
ncbi:MAG: transporter substrate-binding domain-containing protein [Bacteroidales bacterium]|nr:transporter substrate-binding domain-containing protein [Bacteroidales bacterium]